MNDRTIDLYARLSVHEFLLEVIQANQLRMLPTPMDQLQGLRSAFLEKLRNESWSRVDDDLTEPEVTADVRSSAVEIAERYFERLEERLDDLLNPQVV